MRVSLVAAALVVCLLVGCGEEEVDPDSRLRGADVQAQPATQPVPRPSTQPATHSSTRPAAEPADPQAVLRQVQAWSPPPYTKKVFFAAGAYTAIGRRWGGYVPSPPE